MTDSDGDTGQEEEREEEKVYIVPMPNLISITNIVIFTLIIEEDGDAILTQEESLVGKRFASWLEPL